MSERFRDMREFTLRACVSAVVLGVVLYQVDPSSMLAVVRRAEPAWLGLSLVLIYAAVGVKAYKWGMILRSQGTEVGFFRLFDFYLVGLFFNNFLPTSIGGDVVRGFELSRQTDDASQSAASIVSERLVAGASLGLTALAGLLFVPTTPRLTVMVVFFAVACLVLVGLFVHPRLADGLVRRSVGAPFENLGASAGRTAALVREVLRNPGVMLRVGLLSIAFQLMQVLINVVIFRSLGVQVDVGYSLVFIPIISAITMVPFSLSGLGVREAGYVYFYAMVGVHAADAVATSLLFFAGVAVASLPGALFFAMRRRSRENTGLHGSEAEA